MALGEDQESELIMRGDPKHACIFNKWPREIPSREMTACLHSTSAKSLQGNRLERIDSMAAARVSAIYRFHYLLHGYNCSKCSSFLMIIPSTQGQRWVRCVRAHYVQIPEGPVRDAEEEEKGHSYLVYFFQFLPLLLLQEPKRFSSCKTTESRFNREPVHVGRGDGLKARRPADALLWRLKDLNPPRTTTAWSILSDSYFTLEVFTRRHPGFFFFFLRWINPKNVECPRRRGTVTGRRGDSPVRDWAVCLLSGAWVTEADVKGNGHPLSPYKIKPPIRWEDRINVPICSQHQTIWA